MGKVLNFVKMCKNNKFLQCVSFNVRTGACLYKITKIRIPPTVLYSLEHGKNIKALYICRLLRTLPRKPQLKIFIFLEIPFSHPAVLLVEEKQILRNCKKQIDFSQDIFTIDGG